MRRTTRILAVLSAGILAGMAGLAAAQTPPPPDFGSSENPFETNPFGSPPAGSDDPFASDNPFAEPPPPAPPGAGDPFSGGDANPFGGGDTSGANPFAGDDVFGGPAAGDKTSGVTVLDTPFSFGTPETASEAPTPSATRGITELYDFRYVEVVNLQGETVVRRQRMTKEETRQFDETWKQFFRERAASGQDPRFDPQTSDVNAWGEWRYYADQVALWSIYCTDFVLQKEPAAFDYRSIVWPGDPADDAQQQGGEEERNIFNENRSLDDQLGDFFTNPVADTRPGRENATVFDPATMDTQTAYVYNTFLAQLRAFEDAQVYTMKQIAKALEQREERRNAYAEWQDSQKQIIMDYVDEWDRIYEGKITMIEGVRYELYKPGGVPSHTTRGANVVVTDFDLTPHDILNSDGTLRGPADN